MANVIWLAIGHNFAGWDRGASANWTTEADTVRAVVDSIMRAKPPEGFLFVKVPERLSIPERNKWVNERVGSLHACFEFHMDAASATARGCTTFHVTENAWAAGEAKQFQKEYTRVTGLPGRWVKGDTTTRHGRLGAIRDNKVFSLLVELGFITNAEDLKTVREKSAAGIVAGIVACFRK